LSDVIFFRCAQLIFLKKLRVFITVLNFLLICIHALFNKDIDNSDLDWLAFYIINLTMCGFQGA